MTKNVVVWGTGNVGRLAIRAVSSHKDLNLSGVIVHNDSKIGIDAGSIAGIDNLGVVATDDIKIAESPDIDAVVYTVNADFRPDESLSEVLPVLRAGTNVVSTSFHPLLHPPSTPEPMRSQVLEACKEGNSSIFVSGIDPGWIIACFPFFWQAWFQILPKCVLKKSPTMPVMTSPMLSNFYAVLGNQWNTKFLS